MIVDSRMVSFLHSMEPGNSSLLEEIGREAREANVPVIRREMESFLKVLIQIRKPARILEVGTAVGFSTLLMAEAAGADCPIVTIEKFEERIPIAEKNFCRAGREKQITFLKGDAGEILASLQEPFDFIFMDAAKAQYITWLPDILRLMNPGAVLVSDNVLQDGDLIESHFVVERRNRTIYKRMREYLYEIKHHPQLSTTIVPIGDGASVSVKKTMDGNDTENEE